MSKRGFGYHWFYIIIIIAAIVILFLISLTDKEVLLSADDEFALGGGDSEESQQPVPANELTDRPNEPVILECGSDPEYEAIRGETIGFWYERDCFRRWYESDGGCRQECESANLTILLPPELIPSLERQAIRACQQSFAEFCLQSTCASDECIECFPPSCTLVNPCIVEESGQRPRVEWIENKLNPGVCSIHLSLTATGLARFSCPEGTRSRSPECQENDPGHEGP